MAPTDKPTEPANDITGVAGYEQLPAFVQNIEWRNVAISTDEQFAFELANIAHSDWLGRDASVDYPEKDFFMRLAASLPAAYKLKGTTVNESTSRSVVAYLDLNEIYKQYAAANPDDKDKALELALKVKNQQNKWWGEQGSGADAQQQQYKEDSQGLSPEAYVTQQVTEAGNQTLPGQPGWSPTMAEDMTAQEWARTNIDTTLADLGFDESLRFTFKGLVAGTPVGPDGGYDVYKASSFIYDLTPDQLGKLSDSMRRAGYFDRVGGLPRDPTDNRDQQIRMAWDMFLVDVVAAGEEASPQDVLNNRINGRQQQQMPAGATYADEATLRRMANEFGRSIVGRNLTLDEQTSFLRKAREWEKEAILEFGVGQDSPSFTQDSERVDVQSRAELYFQNEFALESSKTALWDWAAKLNK